MRMFKLKFTVTIQELHDAYMEHKKGDSIFICHFIISNLLPRKSILHRLYFSLNYYRATSQFMVQLAKLLNTKRTTYLDQMLRSHPDFQDIPTPSTFCPLSDDPNQTYSHLEFRKAALKRILDLHPNATFTFKY